MNYAGLTDIFEIVIVTLIFSDVSTIKITCCFCTVVQNLSVALLHFRFVTLFSFQGATFWFCNQIWRSNTLGLQIQRQIVIVWWAKVDSNHRPHDYQSCALASWAIGPSQERVPSKLNNVTTCPAALRRQAQITCVICCQTADQRYAGFLFRLFIDYMSRFARHVIRVGTDSSP